MKLSFVLLALGAVLLPTTSAMSPLQQRKNVAVKVSVQRGTGGEAFETVPCFGGGGMGLYVKEQKGCFLFWSLFGGGC